MYRLAVLPLLLVLCACGSQVPAPVSSPTGPPEVPRQAINSSTPVKSADQGFHIVNTGDTLYSIAFRYNLDYKRVASWNRIPAPYVIYPKQVVRLKPQPGSSVISDKEQKPTERTSIASTTKNATDVSNSKPVIVKSDYAETIKWQWPTTGKLINLSSPTSQKGVNISGKKGQTVVAAAAGDVVYSGSGLLGYGKLIIIKHNDSYLSAYAHNEQLLVKEGTSVVSGQKIATMGIDDNRPILHFEIRENGQPIDPLTQLPKRPS
jgi:lipoprotein NlpD